MEKIVTIKRTVTEVKTDNVEDTLRKINLLRQQIKSLSYRLPACDWKKTEEMQLVNCTVDKQLLKLAKTGKYGDVYVGRGYLPVYSKNGIYYKPVYFKADEVVDVKVK